MATWLHHQLVDVNTCTLDLGRVKLGDDILFDVDDINVIVQDWKRYWPNLYERALELDLSHPICFTCDVDPPTPSKIFIRVYFGGEMPPPFPYKKLIRAIEMVPNGRQSFIELPWPKPAPCSNNETKDTEHEY